MKPMLASDYVESKLRFPCFIQPKIDGVRGLTTEGKLTGRSLKEHANRYTTAFYSASEYAGFDGEIAAEHECHPDLCRLTTSALSTIEGEPYTLWHLFDILTEQSKRLPYLERVDILKEHVKTLQTKGLIDRARLVPTYWAHDLETVLHYDNLFLDKGYEGSIIRDPYGMHKEGRSTVREMGLLRIKRFIEEDAVVVGVVEGQMNLNEAQQNELGLQFRSSHQENMVPNGMVGALNCCLVKDVLDRTGEVLFPKGSEITVGAGRMPHDDRKRYMEHPELIIGQTIKFKLFPKGVKDKPRFPTFQSLRAQSDIVA